VTEYTPAAMRRADLFARETRPGFDGWGNEVGKFDAGAERSPQKIA
jgi:N6-adenosine-specific RNA methylase IME4